MITAANHVSPPFPLLHTPPKRHFKRAWRIAVAKTVRGLGQQVITATIAAVVGSGVSLGITLAKLAPRMDQAERDILTLRVETTNNLAGLNTLRTKMAEDIGSMKYDIGRILGILEASKAHFQGMSDRLDDDGMVRLDIVN